MSGDGWKSALNSYLRQRDDLFAGRLPRPADDHGCTMRELVSCFLRSKQAKLEAGELARNTFGDYYRDCARLIDFFGHNRRVNDLRPVDFETLRRQLARDLSVVTLKSEVNKCRIIWKFAHDQRLIAEPIHFGQLFEKPSAKMIRKARNEVGPRLFTADEINQILKSADVYLQAMTLLGINGGLGNTDVANLPLAAIDFKSG